MQANLVQMFLFPQYMPHKKQAIESSLCLTIPKFSCRCGAPKSAKLERPFAPSTKTPHLHMAGKQILI